MPVACVVAPYSEEQLEPSKYIINIEIKYFKATYFPYFIKRTNQTKSLKIFMLFKLDTVVINICTVKIDNTTNTFYRMLETLYEITV